LCPKLIYLCQMWQSLSNSFILLFFFSQRRESDFFWRDSGKK